MFASCLSAPVDSQMFASKKVGVVLAGCGVADGSEIHEATFVLNHISKRGGKYQCFAPDKPQMHVVDHTKGEPIEGATRNVLQEASRIARGSIEPLSKVDPAELDALIFPGGFGAAKNLSDYAVKGGDYEADPEVVAIIQKMHQAGKPLGFCCIAPVLAAKALPGVSVTVGSATNEPEGAWPYAGTAGVIDKVGAKHVEKPLAEAHVDKTFKVSTSAAYMNNTAPIHEIELSVEAMVEGVGSLL